MAAFTFNDFNIFVVWLQVTGNRLHRFIFWNSNILGAWLKSSSYSGITIVPYR